jgi:hypothetical protein
MLEYFKNLKTNFNNSNRNFKMRTNVKILIAVVLLFIIFLISDDQHVKLLKKFKSKMLQQDFEIPQLKYRRELGTLMESLNGRKMVEVRIFSCYRINFQLLI